MQGILNRRYLRVKVFQALYAYDASNKDLAAGEKNMFKSIDQIQDLYLYMLSLISEVGTMAEREIERMKEKRLATEQDLNPNTKFIDNKVFAILSENTGFRELLEKRKISWSIESDNIKKLWQLIKESPEYQDYMANEERSFQEDKTLLITLFKEYMAEYEVLHAYLEDHSIYWYSDLSLACTNVVKTLNTLKQSSVPHTGILLPLYKEKEEDIEFVKNLYRKTLNHEEEFVALIDENTKNWEIERIAKLDILMLRMAICELLFFPEIPVKVTMNEYIELAKDYSTPNSRMFVNGVLDKIVAKLKRENRIRKSGRGLVE